MERTGWSEGVSTANGHSALLPLCALRVFVVPFGAWANLCATGSGKERPRARREAQPGVATGGEQGIDQPRAFSTSRISVRSFSSFVGSGGAAGAAGAGFFFIEFMPLITMKMQKAMMLKSMIVLMNDP